MNLRDYQDWAIKELFAYFVDGGRGNPLVCMPTGTGKSLTLAGFIAAAMDLYPGQRMGVLSHVKEIIGQDAAALHAYAPTVDQGVYCAGLGRSEVGHAVTFASIASVCKKPEVLGRLDLLFVDEAHLVGHAESGMYRTLIQRLLLVNPLMKVIGLTATAFKMGKGMLTEGEDRLFTDIAVDMTGKDAFNWFIDQGYLSRLVPRQTGYQIDVTGVGITAGDYNKKALQAASTREGVTESALEEAIALAGQRNQWLVFATGVEHAVLSAAYLNARGIPTVCVHSKMPDAERDRNIAEFKAGKWMAITNNGVLTTGFDAPNIDTIVMLRLTRSVPLWVQMLGRGTRPVYAAGYDLSTRDGRLAAIADGPKPYCLVLDYGSNTALLGPINDPVIPKRAGKGGGAAPVRLCPECACYAHASLRQCPECGFDFPVHVGFDGAAANRNLIADSAAPVVAEDIMVTSVTYAAHHKEGKPPSLAVNYYSGLTRFRDWKCFEHGGYPASQARDWWRKAAGTAPPKTTAEALARLPELRKPVYLRVWAKQRGRAEVLGVTYEC